MQAHESPVAGTSPTGNAPLSPSRRSAARLVVALDTPRLCAAQRLVEQVAPLGAMLKVGYEAFYRFGDALVAPLSAGGAEFALDLKLHDIPRTVDAAVRALVRPGLRIITVHALGGAAMMRAAVDAAAARATELGIAAPEIFPVTVLTSIGATELRDELGIPATPAASALRLASLARDAGCTGVVCSAAEARAIKARLGPSFATFCPGIRPSGAAAGDQKRVATPAQAVRTGADYLVVGRPITEAADPIAATRAILDEMADAAAAGTAAR